MGKGLVMETVIVGIAAARADHNVHTNTATAARPCASARALRMRPVIARIARGAEPRKEKCD